MQKMVMSLSCDKAVWNAVMNNEAVQDFRRSLHDGMLHETFMYMHESYTMFCLLIPSCTQMNHLTLAV